MLVITRKIGESIVINNDIVITVVQAQRGRVRLGVNAPPGVLVLREELQRRPRPESAALSTSSCAAERGVEG